MNAVIGAHLPLIVTLALGFFAAWRHEVTPEQALVLNRVVLLYALPLLLFAGKTLTNRTDIPTIRINDENIPTHQFKSL
jgi:malonate transporter